MPMRRKATTAKLPVWASGFAAAMNSRFDELHREMRAGFARVAVEMDKRPTRAELDVRFTSIDAKFDRVMTALDRVTGRLHDNSQSHIQFGAMLGDHRRELESHDRRLTALESRFPPTTL